MLLDIGRRVLLTNRKVRRRRSAGLGKRRVDGRCRGVWCRQRGRRRGRVGDGCGVGLVGLRGLGHKALHNLRGVAVRLSGVFLLHGSRRLLHVLSQGGEAVHFCGIAARRRGVDGRVHIGVGAGNTENMVRQSSCTRRHKTGGKREECSGVQSNFAKVSGHVSNSLSHLLAVGTQKQVQIRVCSRMSHGPLQSVENMALHLAKHVFFVGATAHVFEVRDGRHPALFVLVLGRNPQTRASNQLVVFFVHHPFAAVPIDEIDGEKQRLRLQSQGHVSLNDEVQKVRTHVPLELGL